MWFRGDKAACVWKAPQNDGLEIGKVYTVVGVGNCTCPGGGQVLMLNELPPSQRELTCPTCGAPGGWYANRFRKVVEDKREAGAECPALLDYFNKEKVDA